MRTYLSAVLNDGTSDSLVVVDPLTTAVLINEATDTSLVTTEIGTDFAGLSATYGGTITFIDPVVHFIGFTPTGEALWTYAIAATNPAAASFTVILKVLALSSTTRVVAQFTEVLTKKPAVATAMPLTYAGINNDTVYFTGYDPAAPNPSIPIKVYEMKASGVVQASIDSLAATDPLLPGLLISAGVDHLAFGELDSGSIKAYLFTKTGSAWGQVATAAGASSTLFPLTQLATAAATAGLSVEAALNYGKSPPDQPAARDVNGSFQMVGSVLHNLTTSVNVDLQPVFDAAVGGTATLVEMPAFSYVADLPPPAFWQGLVDADEII